jgi:hypothetical protein
VCIPKDAAAGLAQHLHTTGKAVHMGSAGNEPNVARVGKIVHRLVQRPEIRLLITPGVILSGC